MASPKLDIERPTPGQLAKLQAVIQTELRDHWQRFVAEGVVLALIGVAAIVLPNVATLAVAVLVGWLLFVAGIAGTIAALGARRAPGFAYSLMLSLLTAVLGALLALQPVTAIITLTIAMIVYFVAHGAAMVMLAISLRNQSRNWPALIVSGVVDFLLAAIVVSGWPETATWAMGLLLGVNLLFYGTGLALAAVGAHTDASSERPMR